MIPRGNNDSNDLKFDFPVFNGFGELLWVLHFSRMLHKVNKLGISKLLT